MNSAGRVQQGTAHDFSIKLRLHDNSGACQVFISPVPVHHRRRIDRQESFGSEAKKMNMASITER
jgi:hypothetical protein